LIFLGCRAPCFASTAIAQKAGFGGNLSTLWELTSWGSSWLEQIDHQNVTEWQMPMPEPFQAGGFEMPSSPFQAWARQTGEPDPLPDTVGASCPRAANSGPRERAYCFHRATERV
jgi:hypothetical protein